MCGKSWGGGVESGKKRNRNEKLGNRKEKVRELNKIVKTFLEIRSDVIVTLTSILLYTRIAYDT